MNFFYNCDYCLNWMNARSVVSHCAVYFCLSVVLNCRNQVSHTDTVFLKIVVYCIVLEAWFLHLWSCMYCLISLAQMQLLSLMKTRFISYPLMYHECIYLANNLLVVRTLINGTWMCTNSLTSSAFCRVFICCKVCLIFFCEIEVLYSGAYKECCILDCDAIVWFQRNPVPESSG